jgi:hypothetical protein
MKPLLLIGGKQNLGYRVEEALRNLAGMQTVGEEKPFDDLEGMASPHLVPEFHVEAPLGMEIPLFEKFQHIFKDSIDGKMLRRHPTLQRYLHMDLAETAEAAIAMCHKELCLKTGRIMLIYDFICWITSPTRIDLNAIMNLIIDLAEKGKVEFHTISSDQFQSSMIRQELEKRRIAKKVELVSVDKTVLPYFFISKMVNNKQVKTGKAPKLENQLTEITIDDSRKAKKVYSSIRKDEADALVGAGTNAMNNSDDIPTVHWSDDEILEKRREALMNTGVTII